MKKALYLILVLICLLTIFFFSSKNADDSNRTSKSLINKSIIIYEKITHTDIENNKTIKQLNYPIRKIAHFTIFLILGIFIYFFINESQIDKKVLISIIICLVFAILDETHQIFTTGRTPQALDILIDALGSTSSIITLNKIKR